MCHGIVRFFIFKQFLKILIDNRLICSHKFQRSGGNSFRTFSGIAHNKNRYAERWSFFLNSTGIGKYHMRPCHNVMAVKHFNRINNMDAITATKFFICRLTHYGIHMNRIQCFHIWMPVHHAANGTEHMVHRLAKVFTPMCSDENKAATLRPLQFRMGVILANCCL
ncbi:hypothetical protein SDC9_136394 [bioreactor metagenome]|uniref:Uncharacterized protein n=1 Tax=bioreactor metagenome TaxID=1076179 RepID=A0A645DJ03_9ZZZZ